MAETTYNPEEARAMIGASTTTIRNWCKQFADFLSTGANPVPGQERKLTATDVATLQQVKMWRDNNLSIEEIRQRLAEGNETIVAPAPTTIDLAPTDKPQEAILPYAALEALIEAKIERRLRAEMAERRSLRQREIWIYVSGVVSALLLAFLMMWIAYLLVNLR